MKVAELELWAHRGGGKGPLENTLEGFDKAVQAGFCAVEFDIMLSRDEAMYLHHDFELGRLTRPATSGPTPVDPTEGTSALKLSASSIPAHPAPSACAQFADLTSRELAQFQINGQPIPRFKEFAGFLFQHGLQANVELKAQTPEGARRLGQRVAEFINKLSESQQGTARRDWVFSSFYHACLLPLQGYRLALLYEEPLPDNWILRADFLEAEAIHLSRLHVDEASVRRIHASQRKVRVYTVNSLEEAHKLRQIGVDGVFTDDLSFAKADWASAPTAL